MPNRRANEAKRKSQKTRRAHNRGSRLNFLTVGRTARILGISPSTLRQWENIGLIAPVRSQGRFRLYSPEMLDILKRIKYLRDVKQLRVPGIKRELEATSSSKKSTDGQATANLGMKLRRLRKRCNLDIAEAARRAKISSGFLSAVELSQANPSVATLQRLAATYNTTVLEFYDLPHQPSAVIRPDKRQLLRTESGRRDGIAFNRDENAAVDACFVYRQVRAATARIPTPAKSSSTCCKARSRFGSMSWSVMYCRKAIRSGSKVPAAIDGSIRRKGRPHCSGSTRRRRSSVAVFVR